MKVQRVYVDTLVIGGCFDPEFAPWSKGLMKDFQFGNFKPVISEVVTAEIASAPEASDYPHVALQQNNWLI